MTGHLLLVIVLFLTTVVARAQAPRAAHKVGEQAVPFDGGYGYPVYPLGDAKLCPAFSSHFYSYTVQFSVSGDMVFTCGYDDTNHNLFEFPVYDKDFRLLFKDAVSASRLGGMGSHNFSNPQFSQKRRVIYAQHSMTIYELDPWRRKNKVYVNFAGVTVTHRDGSKIKPTVARDFKVGPNDEIVIELGVPRRAIQPKTKDCPHCYEQMGVATFKPATGQISTYSTRNDKKGADYPGFRAPSSGFDESNIAQDGRVYFSYQNRPSWSFAIDFSEPVEFREPAWPQYQIKGKKIEWGAHGHMGFFVGSNGRSYVVKSLSDLIDDDSDGVIDRVGMIGTSIHGKWRPYFLLANTKTGKVEILWGENSVEHGWGIEHLSRSQAKDVVWGSGMAIVTRFEVTYNREGYPAKVEGGNIVNTQSKGGCGYWGWPRVASDFSGERAMFDSTLAGRCKSQVYVVVRATQ